MSFTSSLRRRAVRVAAPVVIVGALTISVAGQAFAGTADFSGFIPPTGSRTFGSEYVTSPDFRDINLTATTNPYDFYVKAVYCDSLVDIDGAKLIEANDHREEEIALDVPDGTCFKLNFSAPTIRAFNVEGGLRY